MNDWKKCQIKENSLFYKHANCFYQKRIYYKDENEIYADIVEYKDGSKKIHELHIQIPPELSLIGMTVDINSFSYKELDLKLIKKDASKIIKQLIK